tara:strand:+ start:6478 stop:8352 length:1875 start_codon:yes stop_codon:yes gene_type:complete
MAIEYIQKDYPDFDIPPYKGTSYESWIPDTLDLAERADLAINGLTGPTDPEADYEAYWQVNFFRNPPIMWHDIDDVQPKFMEALPLLRIITGSQYNNQVDFAWMTTLLRSIGPDGLIYMPLIGRPWAKFYRGPDGYPNPVWKENGQTTNIDDPSVEFIAQPWVATGRLLSTMVVYYNRDNNEIWKTTAQSVVDRLTTLAIHKDSFSYYVEGSFEPNATVDKNSKMPQGVQAGLSTGRLIQGLTHVYKFMDYKPAIELAGKLVSYLINHAAFFDKDGKFIENTEERNFIHFHDHAIDLLFILEYATETKDMDLIKFVNKSYKWARTQGSCTVGFFPEIIEDIPISYKYPQHQRGCLVSETCEVTDMINLALKLTKIGIADYWDDVDRWVRNQFAENQLTRIDWIERIHNPAKEINVMRVGETDERVAERNIGAFAGWPSANDWSLTAGIMHCCTGNGARTIYYVWENVITYNNDKLSLNLLLNHASAWADVKSHIPYEGKVEIKINQRCNVLSIRIPEWIESNSTDVICLVNNHPKQTTWNGRFVEIVSLNQGDTVILDFPIEEKTVTEMIGSVLYTLVIKGNEVVFIDPPGKTHPLYQRAHYRENNTRWKKVKRFVPDKHLDYF